MMLVGLTGGVATGKTTVARMFRECGAVVIDADVLARQVVEPGKPAWREVVRAFGRQVLRPDRTLDRARLADLVFHNRAKLRRLERIIHPRVAREQTRQARAIARTRPHAIIVYDVPLLFEAGVDKRMNRTVVVTAPQHTQIARLRARNGLSRAEALRRIRAQMPLREKVERADYVVDGSQPREVTARHVARIYRELQALRLPSRTMRRPSGKRCKTAGVYGRE